MRTFIAYVPVLHEGYRKFFEKYPGPKELFLFGNEIIDQYSWLAKEIRQLDPELMKGAIESFGIFERVSILDKESIKQIASAPEVILPDEDVSRELASQYFPQTKVVFDQIFLRWDKHNSIAEKPIVPDEQISKDEFDRKMIKLLHEEGKKSSDIWRRIGAAIIKDGEVVLIRHNEHLPSEHSPFVNGDPRNNFHKGDHIETSTAIHAEAGLIAEAARKGIKLEGTKMYVTVFPCPPCAKLIAVSGINELYCEGGYGVLDGESVLKAKGVKIIYVE